MAANKRGDLTWTVTILIALVGFTISAASRSGSKPVPGNSRSTVAAAPCTVDAPADVHAAAEHWCQAGLFTSISVSHDAGRLVVLLRLSDKGSTLWHRDRHLVLNQFRRIAGPLPAGADVNIALSFHDRNGDLVGGCVHKRGAADSICM